MNYKNQSKLLDAKIADLENKQKRDLRDFQIQLDTTFEELKPSSLLSRAVENVKEETKFKGDLLESVVSIVGGYFSKRILIGKSNSMIKNLFGYAIQYLSTRIISKNI